MERRPQINFSPPDPEIVQLFARFSPEGSKDRWMYLTAALLLLAEKTPDERSYLIGEVSRASKIPNGITDLIERYERRLRSAAKHKKDKPK